MECDYGNNKTIMKAFADEQILSTQRAGLIALERRDAWHKLQKSISSLAQK